jgi:hypothetical protein
MGATDMSEPFDETVVECQCCSELVYPDDCEPYIEDGRMHYHCPHCGTDWSVGAEYIGLE